MGTSVYPATSSIIKSIQRGNSSSSGPVTITSVNTAKTFVYSFSNGSAGSAGVTGSFSGTLSPSGGTCTATPGSGWAGATFPTYAGSQSLSAGATSIITSAYGVTLTNATTITVNGSCYWQVVEYN
jgi:hypothetical protein